MSTSISIKGKTAGNDSTTATINYVNPNASNEALMSLANALNNLTTNTITDVTRIQKDSLTDSSKLQRNMKIKSHNAQSEGASSISYSYAEIPNTPQDEFIITGEVDIKKLQVTRDIEGDGYVMLEWFTVDSDNTPINYVAINKDSDSDLTATGTVTFTMPEDEIYQADSVTLIITA